VQTAVKLGLDHAGDAESVAARLTAWLDGTSRPWLMVLDDLRNAEDLEGLWRAGPAGRLRRPLRGGGQGSRGAAAAVPAGGPENAAREPCGSDVRGFSHLARAASCLPGLAQARQAHLTAS
jgi:hypothetical protein